MLRDAATKVVALAAIVLLDSCSHGALPPPPEGNRARGRGLLHQYGCGYCHSIPGVEAARGEIGPPLDDVGRRVYLAGSLPNTPEQMAQWIRFPQSYRPATAMPDLHVTADDARDMVAHLYRLR
ncbi:MAG TPA: c-type cytochrome [Casimicrobiaceae bacterium]|jgi:cytochrome c2